MPTFAAISSHGWTDCRAALRWRDQALPPGDTVCIIHPDNAASLRLAAKLWFQETDRTVRNEDPAVILRRTT